MFIKTFFSEAEKNSPTNVYRYSFTIPIAKAIQSNDESAFLFNFINFNIYPNNLDYKFQFMNYFIKNNKKGHDYFLNLSKKTNYEPPKI